jgi:hypothetical protein
LTTFHPRSHIEFARPAHSKHRPRAQNPQQTTDTKQELSPPRKPALVNTESAIIINCGFESQKIIISGQFFAKNRQFETHGIAINHTYINHIGTVGGVIGIFTFDPAPQMPRP